MSTLQAAGVEERFRGDPVRPRVDVYGLSVDDVVRHIGGWLCDRALAGWEVAARTAEPGDTTALPILGAIRPGLHPQEWSRLPLRASRLRNVVAVSAQALDVDADVRDHLRRVLLEGSTDVVMWGEPRTHLIQGGELVRHDISRAALAFKVHAVAGMTANTEGIRPVELFYRVSSARSDVLTRAR